MTRPPENISPIDRVLVVEDVSHLRDIWLRALNEMGMHGIGAASGEEAMKLARDHAFGIALLDLNLPGMSGLELFGQLRELHPDLAVIIVTGYGTLEAAQRAIQLDVVEFLTKPCGLGELEVAIDRARRRIRERGTPGVGVVPQGEPIGVPPVVPTDADVGPGTTMMEIERQTILDALERNDGNRSATARELGISIRTLYYRLAEYQRQGFLA